MSDDDSRERIELAADAAIEGEVLPGAESEPDAPPEPSPAESTERERQAIAGLLSSVAISTFSLIATRRGEPHWNLTPAEARDVGDATATAIMHYFPWLRMGPALAAAAAWGLVVLPRTLYSQSIHEAARARAREPAPAPAAEGPSDAA